MSIGQWCICDPQSNFIPPSPDPNVTGGEGWAVINGTTLRIMQSATPDSSSAPGYTGQICWDANYIYVCVAPDTWQRTATTTW